MDPRKKAAPEKSTMEKSGKGATGVNKTMEPANSRTPQVKMTNKFGLISPKQKS
jgi:hypothetical protein